MAEVAEKILAHIGTVLRYVAPGFVALFVLVGLDTKLTKSLWTGSGSLPLVAVLLAAVLGFGIYSVHKAIPLLSSSLILCLHRRFGRTATVCLDRERWLRRSSDDPQVKGVQEELDRWSAMINFLYCSGYSMIFLPLIIERIQQITLESRNLTMLLGFGLLVCAWISDFRETRHEFWALEEYPGGKKKE